MAADYPSAIDNSFDFSEEHHGSNNNDVESLTFSQEMHDADDMDVESLRIYFFINATFMSEALTCSFGAILSNTTYAGAPVQFSCVISNPTDQVSGYIPSWNNSGAWVNGSYVSSGLPSVTAYLTGTFNGTVGAKIYVNFYANNSVGAWSSSGSTVFTTIESPPPEEPEEPEEPEPEPPPPATTVYLDFYYHATTHTVNGVTAYKASTDQPNYANEISATGSGNVTNYWGFTMSLQYSGSETSLTGGTPIAVVSQTADGSELLTASWTSASTSLLFGKGALKITLWSRMGAGSWTAQAVYITQLLFYRTLVSSTIEFYIYSTRSTVGADTVATAKWGTPTYLSGIRNIAFLTGSSSDWQKYYLGNSDFIGFLVAPYTTQIGNAFYALVLFGVGMSVYIRYRNLSIVVLMIVLLAGAGGVVNVIVGEAFAGILWLVVAFGLGLTYWRVFR